MNPRPLAFAFAIVLGAATAEAQTYREGFDSGPTSTMLNGVIEFGVKDAWTVHAADGALVLTNTTDPSAVRYYHLDRLRFEGQASPAFTTDATIEVTVTAKAESRAGAGVIVRYDPRSRDYLLFGVGVEADYWVMVRTNGRAQIAGAGTSEAILIGKPNRVHAHLLGTEMVFEVNGVEVIRFPAEETPGRYVGIAAFGKGTFTFDDVFVALPAPAEAPL